MCATAAIFLRVEVASDCASRQPSLRNPDVSRVRARVENFKSRASILHRYIFVETLIGDKRGSKLSHPLDDIWLAR